VTMDVIIYIIYEIRWSKIMYYDFIWIFGV